MKNITTAASEHGLFGRAKIALRNFYFQPPITLWSNILRVFKRRDSLVKYLKFMLVYFMLTPVNTNAQWVQLMSGTTSTLYGIYFLNEDTGFVAGGDASTNRVILKTVNGGLSWETVYSKPTNDNLEAVTFSSNERGFVVGGTQTGGMSPILLYTTDGGNTWNNFTGVPGQGNFSAVKFSDTSNGYTTGANLFQYGMKTNNGGTTWSNLPPVTEDFSTICFVNSDTGFIAPNDGGLLVTNDGGNTWGSLVPPTVGIISDIRFTTATAGIAVGGTFTNPIVLRTVNSGSSWVPVGSLTDGFLDYVSFPDPKHGFAIGFSSSNRTIMFSSTDSGNSWNTMALPTTTGDLYNLCFPKVNIGYAIGDSGRIYKYINTTGVKNITENTGFYVYPNPAEDIIHWNVNSSYINTASPVSLYDIDGRLISTADYKAAKMNIKNIPAGLYILEFDCAEELLEKR